MDARPERDLTEAERLDWLRLIRSENVGPITFYSLLRYYGSAERALDALPELSRRGGRKRAVRLCTEAEAEKELAAVEKAGAKLIAAIEPAYPLQIAAVDDAPPLLSVKGHAPLLLNRTVGIVGARNASANGKRIAHTLAAGLGAAGYTVASGLARGIDTAAHGGSLETGTVAVLAGGVDVCYPPENRNLYDDIAARGCLIAEQPVGTNPQGRHFPPRNRLISGLSLGIVVVEAAQKSGSLITARMAAEQGRDVFAVPGSPLDPRCAGTNDLIRDGAVLTASADDVRRVLDGQRAPVLAEPGGGAFDAGAAVQADENALEKGRTLVLENLSPTPTSVDELIRECQLSPAVVATILLEMELAGRIERLPGNRVMLIAV